MKTTARVFLKHLIPALQAIYAELGEVPEDDSLLTVDEAADLLRVKGSWIYRHGKEGDLKIVKNGGGVRVPMSEVKKRLKAAS